MKLTYGWSCNANTPGGEFLNKSKQTLILNVVSYNIALDKTGQASLTVECKSMQEHFTNTYVGDLGTAANSTLGVSLKQAETIISFLEKAKKGKDGKVPNDIELIKAQLETYQAVEKNARGEIAKNFAKDLKNLREAKLETPIELLKKLKAISFHDVVYTLCHETFQAIAKTNAVDEFEITYGVFNKFAIGYENKSIADFPIDKEKLLKKLTEYSTAGSRTISVKVLLEDLCRSFIQNDSYYLVKGEKQEKPVDFLLPDIVINFSNTNKILTLAFIDAKSNAPITSNELKELQKTPSATIEDKFKGLAKLALGSANTFIKEINLSQISNEYVRSLYIVRSLQESYINARDPLAPLQYSNSVPVNPMTIPLEGSAKLVGHVAWLPIKCFYLSTGLFVLDAVYSIQSVSHTLSREGFETEIVFRWH